MGVISSAGMALLITAAMMLAVAHFGYMGRAVEGWAALLAQTFAPVAWFLSFALGSGGILLLAWSQRRGTIVDMPSKPDAASAEVSNTPVPQPSLAPIPSSSDAIHTVQSTTPPAEVVPAETKSKADHDSSGPAPRRPPPVSWKLPSLDQILDSDPLPSTQEEIDEMGRWIEQRFRLFQVSASYIGAALTEDHISYKFMAVGAESQETPSGSYPVHRVEPGNLAVMLAAKLNRNTLRIERHEPNTDVVLVQTPRAKRPVMLRGLMASHEYGWVNGALPIALGQDPDGRPVVADLTELPHLFVGGTTGSGKSVLLNSIVTCLLLKHTPDSLRLILIDPKAVELGPFEGIPHLLSPVATKPGSVDGVLNWAAVTIRYRFQQFNHASVTNIKSYNSRFRYRHQGKLPYIVIVVQRVYGNSVR